MSTFHLRISSPDGAIFEGDIVQISLRGVAGELAVMAHHIPFITSVVPGSFHMELEGGEMKKGTTTGGILTVDAQKTTLLTGSVTWEEE